MHPKLSGLVLRLTRTEILSQLAKEVTDRLLYPGSSGTTLVVPGDSWQSNLISTLLHAAATYKLMYTCMSLGGHTAAIAASAKFFVSYICMNGWFKLTERNYLICMV